MPKSLTLQDLYEKLESTNSMWHHDSQQYKNMMSALSALNSFLSENSNRVPDATILTNVGGGYDTLFAACNDYLKDKGDRRSSELGNERLLVAKALRDFVSKDRDAFVNTKDTDGKTLSEIISDGRRVTVDITGKNIQRFGGYMSSRMRIKDDEKQLNGFFTPETVLPSFDKAYWDLIESSCQKYDQYKDYIRYLSTKTVGMDDPFLTDGDMIEDIMEKKDSIKENFRNGDSTFKKAFASCREYLVGMPGMTEEKLAELESDPNFRAMLFDIGFQGGSLGISRKMNGNAEIDAGSNIERRNVGMSVVAALIGCPDIVAHAKTMTLKDGDKEIQGVFMENAKGLDMGNAKNEPGFFQGNIFDTHEVKKDLADLQVLDYLCGNIDRHDANYFYEFTPEEDGTPRLTKITGIDNDLSFGKLGANVARNYMVKPQYFYAMNKSTAYAIKNLSKDTLSFALKNLISEEEIEKAWERTQFLQNKIDLGNVFQKGTGKEFKPNLKSICLFDDEDWKEVSCAQLDQYKGENLFGRMIRNQKTIEAMLKENPELAEKRPEVKQEPAPSKEPKPLEIFTDKAAFAKKYSCEMIYNKAGKAQGVNFVNTLSENEPFYRISASNGKLEEYRFVKAGNGLGLVKAEAPQKEIRSFDFVAADTSLKTMFRTLDAVDPPAMLSSSEFRALKKSIVSLNKDFSQAAKDNGRNIDSNVLRDKLDNARKLAVKYLQVKEAQQLKVGKIKDTTQQRINAVTTVLDSMEKLCNAKLGDKALNNSTPNSRALGSLENYLNGISDLNANVKENIIDLKQHMDEDLFIKMNDDSAPDNSKELLARAIMAKMIQNKYPDPSNPDAAKAINTLFSGNPDTKRVEARMYPLLTAHINKQMAGDPAETKGSVTRSILENDVLVAGFFTKAMKAATKDAKAVAQQTPPKALDKKKDELPFLLE